MGVVEDAIQRERFEQRVRAAERLAYENPRAYRVRVVLLGLLGYAVLAALVAVLVGIVAGSVWLASGSFLLLVVLIKSKLILLLLPVWYVAYAIARVLWMRFDPPDGYRVERARAPRLFQELDALRRALKLPPIHEVIVTGDHNAALVQTPRLGPFGWYRNTLVLGLPFFLSLTPGQGRAVLAHELGHLSGAHGRAAVWLYRVRMTWMGALHLLQANDTAGGALLHEFFKWYVPYFSAYGFALFRAQEYEADAASAHVTSVNDAALALVNSAIREPLNAERFWGPLLELADREPEPVRDPFTRLSAFLRDDAPAREDLLACVRSAMREETAHVDTHPALRDRLAALDAPPLLPEPVRTSAAEVWFGAALRDLLGHFDAQWREAHADAWHARHRQAQEARARLEVLRRRDRALLTDEEAWQLAELSERFEAPEQALPLYRDYQRRKPDDPDADLAIGRLLAARDNPAALVFLNRAAASGPARLLAASRVAVDFHMRRGEAERAQSWRQRADAEIDRLDEARRERAGLRSSDTFLPPELDAVQQQILAERLRSISGLAGAWLARKAVRHFPEEPLFVLLVTAGAEVGRVIERIHAHIELPGASFIVDGASAEGKRLARRIRPVAAQLV